MIASSGPKPAMRSRTPIFETVATMTLKMVGDEIGVS
jgi:hypothetical protein